MSSDGPPPNGGLPTNTGLPPCTGCETNFEVFICTGTRYPTGTKSDPELPVDEGRDTNGLVFDVVHGISCKPLLPFDDGYGTSSRLGL